MGELGVCLQVVVVCCCSRVTTIPIKMYISVLSTWLVARLTLFIGKIEPLVTRNDMASGYVHFINKNG